MPIDERQVETFHAHSRQEWRDWLAEHHATATGLWLISYKKTSGKPRVSYNEAVEEALCFGWIDSRPNALDDERYMLYFSPRRPRSPWSKLNKERVERLIAQGLMMPAGLAKIEAAQRDGGWTVYDAIETLTMPDDLAAALAAQPGAARHFDAFSNAATTQLLWWVESAKRPETRQRRIEQIVLAAAENRSPLANTPK